MNKKWSKSLHLINIVFFSAASCIIQAADQAEPISELPARLHPWTAKTRQSPGTGDLVEPSLPFILAGILCFMAAAISSAGGIGGGGLFISILAIVAGFDLKTATSFSAFMVTGVSVANVVCFMYAGMRNREEKSLINYDIALLSQPCVLLGVSAGIFCNQALPEWLITVLLVGFLGFCTLKTFKTGIKHWRRESELLEKRLTVKSPASERVTENLLSGEGSDSEKKPWMKVCMLVLIWFSFLLLYLLNGDHYGQGIMDIEACGTAYWIIASLQIPLALFFTAWISYSMHGKALQEDESFDIQEDGKDVTRNQLRCLPVMALLVGFLSGVFGIGGGMLISPLLLQIGLQPQATAATCSFMVFFSASMSSIQFSLLGMEQVKAALIYSMVCFAASLIGSTLVQRAIRKHGRASAVVFAVALVLALSAALMASYGAVKTWRDYTTGQFMGFNKPC